MGFTRAFALVSLLGTLSTISMGQAVRAQSESTRPLIEAGAPVPKDTPRPETFVIFDTYPAPGISNEVTPGKVSGLSGRSFGVRGAAEFTTIGSNFDLEINYRRYAYMPVPKFIAQDFSLSARVGMQVSPDKIYAGLGYLKVANNYAFPPIGGLGIGVSKLPILDRKFSFGGGLWYYPNLSGSCPAQTCAGGPFIFTYHALEYDLGATYDVGSRLFLNAGYQGDHLGAKFNSPSDIIHAGASAGLGVRL